MIRQAISCDICGAEKRQTNHWFVASEQAGELRVSGWSSRNRLRPGTKHLCGQTCLHKLVDEYVARTIAGRVPPTQAEVSDMAAQLSEPEEIVVSDVYSDATDSVRRVPAPAIAAQVALPAALAPSLPAALPTSLPTAPLPKIAAAAAVPPVRPVEENRPMIVPARIDEAPNYNSRHWRNEAWERERERESRAAGHAALARQRKSS